jgi:hypothetical protein
MSNPRKIQREQSPPPAKPRQMSIVFESNGLRGLSTAERTKALMNRKRKAKPSVIDGESVLKLEDERKAASGDAGTPESGRGGRISSGV